MAAPTYLAWMVLCKTPSCNMRHILKFIGLDDGQPLHFLPAGTPHSFDLECDGCGMIHSYTTKNLELQKLDAPPPADFVDRF
jgi:hypothetical protein